MKAHALNVDHLGATITFKTPEGVTTGLLSAVRHEADLISDRRLDEETERYALGRTHTFLTLAGWGERQVGLNTEITIGDYS